mmetsp:Transcript_43027/g.78609  ORF Transcript_43027/g.78609 Transcript_43027/m.78609 type:complete len:190 (-) Transcript_43027:61-630(-)
MKLHAVSILAVLLPASGANANLRAAISRGEARRDQLEVHADPDTSCGRGFDNLVDGSKAYFTTAFEKLWTHPGHSSDKTVFEQQFKCWFANMLTQKCGGLPSQADARKKKLVEKCADVTVSWQNVAKLATEKEYAWYARNYPAAEVEGETDMKYLQVMATAKKLNTKELMCLTLFTIDDKCVEWPYIRM